MGPMCEFYGYTPSEFRRVPLPDLRDLIDHMHEAAARQRRQQYG